MPHRASESIGLDARVGAWITATALVNPVANWLKMSLADDLVIPDLLPGAVDLAALRSSEVLQPCFNSPRGLPEGHITFADPALPREDC